MKKKLVFDIETIGADFDKLDPKSQEDLTRYANSAATSKAEYDKMAKEAKETTALSPLTGEIVAIGVYDPDQNKGAVYYRADKEKTEDIEEKGIKYVSMTEEEMLVKFWSLAEITDEFVSFYGRGMDVPFMMIRSAIHHIRPTKDLMSNRYNYSSSRGAIHYDLYDLLTFYGASRKKGSLHLWCKAFGIKSPKSTEFEGKKVTQYFKQGKYLEIAKYNALDLRATAELFSYWEKYLKFS
ncbi:MAG: ribonuclease H-like domain-containing protein [bacterium]|nr:ribonuclease H-like domain-containing protein [bacterium]